LKLDLDRSTGALFESLWSPYDVELFEQSVGLFDRRLRVKGVDPHLFAGKACLDAGCGGGRNALAMARLGAASVEGIDLGGAGIDDARKRGAGMSNLSFREGSVEALPFPDDSFDVVWFAGVLMHTGGPDQAITELTRVLRPGGLLYALVYATGGLRWPLITLLRPLAAEIGIEAFEDAIEVAGLAANKRRTFLDDLFVPRIDFYTWARLSDMLSRHGLGKFERWGPDTRLDHEHDLAAYRTDLTALLTLLEAGCRNRSAWRSALFEMARALTAATVATVVTFETRVTTGDITFEAAMTQVVGQGHHRLFATLTDDQTVRHSHTLSAAPAELQGVCTDPIAGG
jgi:SAM-dependent methyltransferase